MPEAGRGSRRREEARQVEFVRVGQALKLDTIVKGDAPTSLASTGLFRRSVSSAWLQLNISPIELNAPIKNI